MKTRVCRLCSSSVTVQRHPRFVEYRCTACPWKTIKVKSLKGG